MENKIKIVIDNEVLAAYNKYYFERFPRRRKVPIAKPIPPSMNQWLIMPRHQMNALKQIWKEFGVWLVEYNKLDNKQIDKCDITIEYFFDSKRVHDSDNYTPKYLFDSFTQSGLLINDDFSHVQSLTIRGNYCKENPRTEITINF